MRQLCVVSWGLRCSRVAFYYPYVLVFVWKIRPFACVCVCVYVHVNVGMCVSVLVLIPLLSYNEVELQLHYELLCHWLEVI